LEKRIGKLERELQDKKRQWLHERETIAAIRHTKRELENQRRRERHAERAGDLTLVSEIRYGTIPELERKLQEQEEQLRALQKEQPLLKEEVEPEKALP
jgi:ATP-dependent Clp protease ATP-binding subunit ClpB